jgi:glycosyltransferase involved in cell wall biosynthesis
VALGDTLHPETQRYAVGDSQIIRRRLPFRGMPDERIVTFRGASICSIFAPAQIQAEADRPFTLLSTRNWEPIYGVDVIARAVSSVQQTLEARQAAAEAKNGAPQTGAAQTGPDLRMVMLGNGSQAAMLRQILMRGSFNERISFPGQVSFTNLPNYYRMADLYIAASHSDGTSISLLEAMACGRPVLVSDIPGNRMGHARRKWLPSRWRRQRWQCHPARHRPTSGTAAMGRRFRQIAEERRLNKNFQQLLGTYRKMVN